jgi:hypothetical protein
MELKDSMINFIQQYYYVFLVIILLAIFFFYSIYMRNIVRRVVVFDLDETLGCFVELGMFCDAIEKYYRKKLTIAEFHNIMDLYPEFLRPNILKILTFLKEKRENGNLYKVYLYTNNQGPKSWSEKICLYLEKKIGYKLFDKIIGAWKVNGRIVEPTRTTHDKTLTDFLKTTKLSINTEICFVDDLYHHDMNMPNVYYINIVPYTAHLSPDLMCERFYKQNKKTISNKHQFCAFIMRYIASYDISSFEKSSSTKKQDSIIGKELFAHLQIFLETKPKSQTKKNKSLKKRSTLRRNN